MVPESATVLLGYVQCIVSVHIRQAIYIIFLTPEFCGLLGVESSLTN